MVVVGWCVDSVGYFKAEYTGVHFHSRLLKRGSVVGGLSEGEAATPVVSANLGTASASLFSRPTDFTQV